jgi:hypothetical protein
MHRFVSCARSLTLAALGPLAIGGLLLPAASTGCSDASDCYCIAGPSETYAVDGASRKGSTVYLSLHIEGEACCGDGWEDDAIVRVDLAGYSAGDLVASSASELVGDAVDVEGPAGEVTLDDLGLVLQPVAASFDVTGESPRAIRILAADTREELGRIAVPSAASQ